MKYKIILILLLTCSAFAFPQNKSEKSFVEAKYKCVYSVKYINDIAKMTYGTEDHFILLIGEDLAYGDSFLRSNMVSLSSNPKTDKDWFKSFVESFKDGTIVNYYSSLLMFACIYKDYKENKIKVIDKISGNFFLYEEENEPQSWILHDDTITIAGYLCQKALCQWRGRDYEAWFTPEIPINEGPWKFHGLPGLIIKLHDTQLHYEFDLLEFKETNEKININPLITKTFKYFGTHKLQNTDRITFLRTQFGGRGDVIRAADQAKLGITYVPSGWTYSYIELDY